MKNKQTLLVMKVIWSNNYTTGYLQVEELYSAFIPWSCIILQTTYSYLYLFTWIF